MKVAMQDIPPVLVDYMEKNMLAKSSGWQKAAVGALMFAAANKSQALISDPTVISAGKMLGLIDSDNLVDIAYARDMARDALHKAGGKLNGMGYIFDEADIEALYESAKIVAR